MKKLAAWLSSLRVAIALLLLIALASGIGTAIPQGDPDSLYLEAYADTPWLGVLHGEQVLLLQLDHVYSSSWFLGLIAWLGLSLILCSWRRQWPALMAARRWIDYRTPQQLSKLSIAETRLCSDANEELTKLHDTLVARGWNLKLQSNRFAARKGVIGRVGPLLVHAGMVVLMVGAVWGVLGGNRLERFLAPGRSLDLLNRNGDTQLSIRLDAFEVERDPAGRPEQFRSLLSLSDSAEPEEISVNHPLRHRGITIYQADWSLAAVTVQIGRSPELQLPLQTYPELGEQVWGLVLPTRTDGSEPVFLSLDNEKGPASVYKADGQVLTLLRPGGPAKDVNGVPLRMTSVLPASGLLLKRDPGVPLVYLGFAVLLLGGGMSLISTRQIWAVADAEQLHVGGLCNRNLTAFAGEIPKLLSQVGGLDQQG